MSHKLFDVFLAFTLLFTYVGEHFGLSIEQASITLVLVHGGLHLAVFLALARHIFKNDDN